MMCELGALGVLFRMMVINIEIQASRTASGRVTSGARQFSHGPE